MIIVVSGEKKEVKMQTVGFEPTRANTLRPERSTLDHSVIFAYVYFSHLAYFNGTSDSSSFVLQSLLSYCTHKIGNSTPIISTVEFNRDYPELPGRTRWAT